MYVSGSLRSREFFPPIHVVGKVKIRVLLKQTKTKNTIKNAFRETSICRVFRSLEWKVLLKRLHRQLTKNIIERGGNI